MDTRQRTDDAYKRKLQKIKVKNVEHVIQFPSSGKNTGCKLHPLKVILVTILLGTFITILSSPTVCHKNSTFHTVSRSHVVNKWVWGGSNPPYPSDLDINWNDMSRALKHLPQEKKIQRIGLLNFNETEINQWTQFIPTINHTVLHLDPVSENVTWDSLYPEWIDEEQDSEVPTCPSLPTLHVPTERLDLIAVKLPCRNETNWSRDIARLHLQISVARLAASCKGSYPVHLVFVTKCFPTPNMFTCKERIAREGHVWLYTPNLKVLREKVNLPVGSCELAVPLGVQETDYSGKKQREAYVTILHSANMYVCGAIAAAQSIRMAGSTRDLVILVDESISDNHRRGLEMAGWKIRTIKRIRNPKAEKDAYNEWNYSKFRLWQLTDYEKIIFLDADMLILKNIDFLFGMPEISATGNHGSLFNSGLMVMEPSNCTFQLLMDHINDIESYNGGDQGYLNEIFTWWHRVPKQMNFLKNFWGGDNEQARQKKISLFESDPPEIYVLHYLGNKPWLCYRDYDCNWNVDVLQEFASNVAHRRWWRLHDAMPKPLQEFCLLRSKQKAQLEWDRRQAEIGNYSDGHWRIKIQDGRINTCIDSNCDWLDMVNYHWRPNQTAVPVPSPLSISAGSTSS